MTGFRWCTASAGTLPFPLFGRAAHQAAQAPFVASSQGTASSCLPSSRRRTNGDEMGYVSAVLHLEPWTSFCLYFGWLSVLVPFSLLFPRHPWCHSRVQVFVRLQLSELYTRTVLPKGKWKILNGLHQSGRERCSSPGPKREEGSCVCQKNIPSTKISPALSQEAEYLWAEQKVGRGSNHSQELRTSLVVLNKAVGWGCPRGNEWRKHCH